MNEKQVIRIIVDLFMTVILLLLMGYSRVGETAHEWLGIAMFSLLIVHHLLNRKWIAGAFKGKYTLFRIFQTAFAVLLLLGMTGSALSGVILSKHIFRSLNLGGASQAREIHMLCGYWNFVLMSLHLGLHWNVIIKMISKKFPKDRTASVRAARIAAALIAGYGAYAFFARQMQEYLFGLTKFAFIDLEEPLILFLMDYVAVMGLFVFLSYYICTVVRKLSGRNKITEFN